MEEQPIHAVDEDTLELIYSESKAAYERLMADIEFLDEKANGQLQTSLIIIGVLFTVASTTLSSSWSNFTWVLFILAILMLAISGVWIAYIRIRGEFYSGTIFPHILMARVEEGETNLKAELIDVVSRSYYYNYQEFIRKARHITIASGMQIIGMAIIVFLMILETLRRIEV